MRDYELVVIISPQVPEEEIPANIDKVSEFITSRGGSITGVDRWGKKRMSYPIKRSRDGNYVLTKFKFAPEKTAELEASLRISENILRHLLVKMGS